MILLKSEKQSSVKCMIVEIKSLIDCFRAGVWAWTPLQPTALPVGTGARRTGAGAATDRDSGKNLVPESTLQDEAEAGAGCRATASSSSSVGGGGDGECVSSSGRQSFPGERRQLPAVRTTCAADFVEPSCRHRRRSRRRRPPALATSVPADCRCRQF